MTEGTARESGDGRTLTQMLFAGFRDGQRGLVAEMPVVARPWWYDAPSVAMGCLRVAGMPFRFVVDVAEAAVSVAVLAVLVLVGAWYTGHVKDEDVVAALRPVGAKVLGMVQRSADGGQSPKGAPAP